MMKSIEIKNNQPVVLDDIPALAYPDFLEYNLKLVTDPGSHCVNYFGQPVNGRIRLICCIASDTNGTIHVNTSMVDKSDKLPSLTRHHFSFHIFEREIHESFGLEFTDHPWLKPVRYPWYRTDQSQKIENYPFYHIESEELHEVGVGPIHAGIIEPGHFRFICNGEQILHLEIQLGFQHRGIEKLMVERKDLLSRTILAESIAGDTVVGHTSAFSNLWESLCGFIPSPDLIHARTLALEWERIAIHTGDLSAIATDIAYQLGSSVFGRLRTPIINAFQIWGGNRLAKGLIRPFRNRFPFSPNLRDTFNKILDAYYPDYTEMFDRMIDLPSILSRLEKTGVVTREQSLQTGTVGIAARSANLERDIRKSHPCLGYNDISHSPLLMPQGDVYARTRIRDSEIRQSIGYARTLMENMPRHSTGNQAIIQPASNSFIVSLVEGWRGEICHAAITDNDGELILYKIKDPSMHNWTALALAVRNNEISDFPICNKSFNLSYCGFDL